jgi:hemoglobin
MNRQSLLEKYGGFAQVSRIVTSFYDKLLDSPVTSPYFANIDMRRLIDHQTRFIATVMGGPASYTNDHLERVHANLGITEAAFVEAMTLLKETLEEFGVVEEDVLAVEDEMMSRKHFIVSKS